jgi:hypothetical protein
MNENLNLIEILKDCPKGTKLYSLIHGYVTLDAVIIDNSIMNPIIVNTNIGSRETFTKDGRIYKEYNGECMLFPSKDNRDWSTLKVPNKLPKTWEEFCENHPIKGDEYYITSSSYVNRAIPDKREDGDANLLPNKEYAEAMLALCQLIQLRDCYNGGWKPDWLDKDNKYIITVFNNHIIGDIRINEQNILAFKTKDILDEFVCNFKDLIETAKPLL